MGGLDGHGTGKPLNGLQWLSFDPPGSNLEPVPANPPFQARSLATHDLEEALYFAREGGLHGLYVANALVQELEGGGAEGHSIGLFGADGLVGLLWFGDRGNLIMIHGDGLEPERVAAAVIRRAVPWRIALGPKSSIAVLAGHQRRPPIVDRCQVYYGVRDPAALDARAEGQHAEKHGAQAQQHIQPRTAMMADLPSLMEAALALNESDLGVPPDRVDRSWLRATVANRVREGSTWVIGPEGRPWCKLDFGSLGGDGLMVEGIYTEPVQRGKGLATALLAHVARTQLTAGCPVVCLHVASDNAPARRCYSNAGLTPESDCRILLLP